MTAQDLKNSILQLAVQGKLVPQDSNDEPASELLKRIRTEKERLVKEGKIKKDKALAPITEDEIPFDIPENWEWIRLGELVIVISGTSYKSGDVSDSGLRILRGGNLQNSKIEYYDNDVFLPQNFGDEEKTIKADDILIVASTGSKAVIGKPGFVSQTDKNTQIGAFLRIVRPLFHEFSNYLRLLFDSEFYRNHIRCEVQGMNINNVKTEHITEFVVPVPPLAEQERIVAKIEELLPYIEEYDKAEKQLSALNAEFPDKLRKSILQQAVMGKLTERDPADEPASELLKRIRTEKEKLIKEGKIKKEKPLPPISEDEIPFEIPDTWEWVRLGSVADMCLGKMLDKSKNKGELRPYLRNVNVRWGEFDFSDVLEMRFLNDEEERYSVHYGDLVVCEGGEPGRCAVWADQNSTFRIQKALHRVRFYYGIDSFFAYRVFQIYASNGYFAHRFSGETIKHLPGVVLAKIAFPLPPLSEQKRIVARVEELLKLCDELK